MEHRVHDGRLYQRAGADLLNGFFGNVGGSSWHRLTRNTARASRLAPMNCGTSGHARRQPDAAARGYLGGYHLAAPAHQPVQHRQRRGPADEPLRRLQRQRDLPRLHAQRPLDERLRHAVVRLARQHQSSGGNNVAYGYIPYMPDAGTSCGMNFVNACNNSYGNGYFDGFSIVAGHEFIEAETDMNPSTSRRRLAGSGRRQRREWRQVRLEPERRHVRQYHAGQP